MKTFVLSSVVITSLLTLVGALPQPQPRAQCVTQKVRKEWSSTTASEKSSYIAAVKCLDTKPSKIGTGHSLYNDFTYIHNMVLLKIHSTAQFLPWHRYFLHLYEKELNSCGYSGAMPYWDWETAANGNVTQAAIWSASNGFGGDGIRQPGGYIPEGTFPACITTGPFTALRPVYWGVNRYFTESPHCINRQWARPPGSTDVPVLRHLKGETYNTTAMNVVRAANNYDSFRVALENGPHSGVHTGIGGEMAWVDVSPNDPVFFLHHAQVDRAWWKWQQQNPSARNFDYSGNLYPPVGSATLDDLMLFSNFAPDLKVRDVMTTNTERLCYKY